MTESAEKILNLEQDYRPILMTRASSGVTQVPERRLQETQPTLLLNAEGMWLSRCPDYQPSL
ncbi:MAG: hypothetical protein KME07_22995 [Pegethrix bostrychoides GSE-TBD4-15B]|uniref:Uncharacterized protein n=1 Tax=Pegethrix bostrychoides GSE-TBD4-15B TaxID=2839662 RepID=A0A951PFX4_9CYAN|nr:hypothetical protein [Pegethrix bostrychoides GSE-TBD4-15B]